MNLCKQLCYLTILRVERRKDSNKQNQFKDREWIIVQEELPASEFSSLLEINLN